MGKGWVEGWGGGGRVVGTVGSCLRRNDGWERVGSCLRRNDGMGGGGSCLRRNDGWGRGNDGLGRRALAGAGG